MELSDESDSGGESCEWQRWQRRKLQTITKEVTDGGGSSNDSDSSKSYNDIMGEESFRGVHR